uniref:Uncharacterized protein n=1 Tax=Parascaris univalens TaxID=6257 RepID=A0A914ZKE2_PARUN
MLIYELLIFECTLLSISKGLTLDERNELFRKFKYYFASVRPNAAPNRITTINGSFFALTTELQLISATPHNGQLNLEFYLVVSFVDDRLVLRELEHRFQMSAEFQPWLPDLATHPTIPWTVVTYLDPRSGIVTAFYKFRSSLSCKSDTWRHPFEIFYCDLIVSNNGDERILLQNIRDLRTYHQLMKVHFSSSNWPQVTLQFSFAHKWHSSLVSSLLPSLLVFCVVIFAQWKRRKTQLMITVIALLCIVIMQSTHRSGTVVTLEDLWLSCTLLHVVCVLLVDLALPARRLRYAVVVDNAWESKSLGHDRSILDMRPMRMEQTLTRSGSVQSTLERPAVDDGHQELHLQMATAWTGARKRIALSSIIICYVIFVVAYICFVVSIIT